MSAGAAVFSAYLKAMKEWYGLNEGLIRQYNDTTEVLDIVKKATVEWHGKEWVIAIDVERHGGSGWVGPNGQLPDAGHAEPQELRGTSGTYAVRGQIDRKLMKAAPKVGLGSFIKALDFQYEKMREQAATDLDAAALWGGLTKGYINEHKASDATNGGVVLQADILGTVAGGVVWEWSGTFDYFKPRGLANDPNPASKNYKGLTLADHGTWIRAKLVRQDTYAEVVQTGGAAVKRAIFIVAYDEVNCTITLENVADAAGSSFTTATVANGFATALEMHQTQFKDVLGNNFGGVCSQCATEAAGLFHNFSTQNHWNLDRTTATGFTVVQGNCLNANDAAGAEARTAITPKRIQAVTDRVEQRVGAKAATLDVTLMNALQRAAYVGVLTANTQFHSNGGNGSADIMPGKILLNGAKIRTARQIPRSMYLFLSTNTLKLVEYAPGDFINEDGNILSRVPGYNHLEMCWTWDYNVICTKPAACAVLVGMAL